MAAPDAAQITRWRRRRPFEDAQSACVPALGSPRLDDAGIHQQLRDTP
jgi:hypothetical protein